MSGVCVKIAAMMKANFTEISTPDALEELFVRSQQQPVVVFKHSVSCPISLNVHAEVARNYAGDIALVIVQRARALSNDLAARTGVRHESPQALVLRDGKAVWHASHYDIEARDLHQAVTAAA